MFDASPGAVHAGSPPTLKVAFFRALFAERSLVGCVTGQSWLTRFVSVLVLGIAISYLLASLIRLARGKAAAQAFLPNSVLIGAWAGFALFLITAMLIIKFMKRRHS